MWHKLAANAFWLQCMAGVEYSKTPHFLPRTSSPFVQTEQAFASAKNLPYPKTKDKELSSRVKRIVRRGDRSARIVRGPIDDGSRYAEEGDFLS